jgi:hypothetical protein
MTRSALLPRARNILLNPRSEWPVAAAEPDSVAGVFVRYVLVLAALPALAQFLRDALIGYHLLGMELHTPVRAAAAAMALEYAISLALVYAAARLANALAATFGARPDMVQAVKAVAYAWTAAWIAGIAMIVPWLGWLVGVAGVIYSIYLLNLGLPHVMQCPEDRAAGYAAAIVAVTMILWALAGSLAELLNRSLLVPSDALLPQYTEVISRVAQAGAL